MVDKQLNLFNVPSIETPLKYMGGKRNFFSCFNQYLPKNTKEIISPFLGGAGLELRLTSFGIRVYGSDFFEPLVNFWNYWIKDADLVIEDLMTFYPISYEERKYYTNSEFQKGLPDYHGNQVSDLRRASLYWNVTSVGWAGANLKQALSSKLKNLKPQRFLKFRNWSNDLITVNRSDYRKVLENTKGKLLYLDPPYVNQEHFYHQDAFDHNELFTILEQTPNWMLSYGSHEIIRNLYKEFDVIDVSWNNKGKIHNELLILNL